MLSGRQDRPVVFVAVTLTFTLFVIVANLLVDLALAALDPRTRER